MLDFQLCSKCINGEAPASGTGNSGRVCVGFGGRGWSQMMLAGTGQNPQTGPPGQSVIVLGKCEFLQRVCEIVLSVVSSGNVWACVN